MYIIIVDLRENNGGVLAITDENDNIALFKNYEEASDVMSNHKLNVFPITFVDLDGGI